MFGFSRLTKYDEDYLNKKKSILEDLLGIKERLEKLCIEYDDTYSFLSTSYKTAQNTDYIGMFLKRSRREKPKKSMDEIIREALTFQNSELKKLKAMLDLRFISVFNEQLINPNAPYHLIFKNTLGAEQAKFDDAYAWYSEIRIISFIKFAYELDAYLQNLNIIYSSFLANEYSKLKQVR